MLEATPDVGIETLRALLRSGQRAHVVDLPAVTLTDRVATAHVATHLAALRGEPDGGWLVVRGLTREQARDFERVQTFVGVYLSTPRTLLSAVHDLDDELVALVYVDAAPRGFEVLAADGEPVFRKGDVFVRRAGRTERWTPAHATQLVDRVVARRSAAGEPARERRSRVEAFPPDALLARATDLPGAYAAGALAVRLGRWDVVREAAKRQGPPETIAQAQERVRADPLLRGDGADDNAVLDSLCQLDAYAALVALHAAGDEPAAFGAGFARYWAQRTRPALRLVVTDPDVRRAIFPGPDERLAAALRALDAAAAGEAADAGGWLGLGDPVVEAFVARAPG